MGPDIVIPLVVVAVFVPLALVWANRRFRQEPRPEPLDIGHAATARLTGSALIKLPQPPWRLVHEIAPGKLGDVEHVLVGPAGVLAVTTAMDAMPLAPIPSPDAMALATVAIGRGPLDDALRRCAISSNVTVRVFWGPEVEGAPASIDLLPGLVAVDGRSLVAWAESLPADVLTPAQVDLAWQTVATAIGRPDPLG